MVATADSFPTLTACELPLDLLDVDLRGRDLCGVDLEAASHLALAELVALEDGAWVPLAAWDADTRFPPEVEEMLWLMGVRDPVLMADPGWRSEGGRRGRCARRHPLDKSRPGILETHPGRWSDG